jgi:hypothetical protein
MLVQPSSVMVAMTVRLDEDWCDSLPPIPQRGGGGGVMDLTGATALMFIRPDYGHPTLIRKLSSDPGDIATGLVIDDAAHGLVSIQVPRSEIIRDIPLPAKGRHWVQFLVIRTAAVKFVEIWRGPLYVLPGSAAL